MFSVERATALAAYFLQASAAHRLNDLKLMKLMYIAERESLKTFNASITDSNFSSMQNGPVLADVIRLFKNPKREPFWDAHILFVHVNEGQYPENTVELKQPLLATDFFSTKEITLLNEIWRRYRLKRKWALVDLVHEFPEWNRSAASMKTSLPITLVDIFSKGFGEPYEHAKNKADDLEYYRGILA